MSGKEVIMNWEAIATATEEELAEIAEWLREEHHED